MCLVCNVGTNRGWCVCLKVYQTCQAFVSSPHPIDEWVSEHLDVGCVKWPVWNDEDGQRKIRVGQYSLLRRNIGYLPASKLDTVHSGS